MEWLKEWAVPLSAGATFLLALAAFWAIWQNYSLNKKERRERLLNEIIEWAIDIGRATNVENIPHTAELDDILLKSSLWSNIQNKLLNLETKAEYIETLAGKNFGETLRKAVEDLTNKLMEVLYLTAKGPLEIEDPEDSFDMTG
jgi:hypothetical protein